MRATALSPLDLSFLVRSRTLNTLSISNQLPARRSLEQSGGHRIRERPQRKAIPGLFVATVCGYCLWLLFVATVCGYCLWLLFVATVCGYCLWLLFVAHKREVAAQASIPRSPTPSHTPRYMSYMSYILLLGVYKHTI